MVLNPLGEIVRDEWFRSAVAGFKSAVTKRINEHRDAPDAPVWQRNYHEYTIRNDRALSAIREYIQNDPLHWHLERYNPDSTGSDPLVRRFGWILYG